MMKKLFAGLLISTALPAMAQDTKTPPLTVSGYIETYYNYDFNRVGNNTIPPFLYNFNRTNEVNLNLGLIQASYNTDRVRANVALAAGTYMNANYAAESGVMKNLYQANIGFRLSAKSNLWLDAGIMPSHIGWESAIGKDNLTLSRSLAAENSPYFESGAKLGYTSPSGKWYLSAMVLNGWQRIQRPDGNTTPAFGTQVTFKPSAYITLNSSSFAGNDKPDSLRRMRYFHDLYGTFQLSDKWLVIAGFDIGAEQKDKGSSRFYTWYTPDLIVRYAMSKTVAIAARAEYYHDPNGVIVSTNAGGLRSWGYSANLDYHILDNLLWRIELRDLSNRDDIFIKRNGDSTNNNLFVTTALAFNF
ncbi:porin [Mucilaginibacter sp. SMC90]|uniref:porin n=1 Tax=Mucilaginibacter sp. SMC90 TaxID=2929803 RepID=UPI001FB41F7C|nr:porin [Mucilaginibacter sp. SMC90]UOE46567.1 porin [Mucilaginibacter sp. SMC90]